MKPPEPKAKRSRRPREASAILWPLLPTGSRPQDPRPPIEQLVPVGSHKGKDSSRRTRRQYAREDTKDRLSALVDSRAVRKFVVTRRRRHATIESPSASEWAAQGAGAVQWPYLPASSPAMMGAARFTRSRRLSVAPSTHMAPPKHQYRLRSRGAGSRARLQHPAAAAVATINQGLVLSAAPKGDRQITRARADVVSYTTTRLLSRVRRKRSSQGDARRASRRRAHLHAHSESKLKLLTDAGATDDLPLTSPRRRSRKRVPHDGTAPNKPSSKRRAPRPSSSRRGVRRYRRYRAQRRSARRSRWRVRHVQARRRI